MYDAVELTARALHALEMSQRQRIELKSLNCKKQNTWNDGQMVLEALRKVSEALKSHFQMVRYIESEKEEKI
jgi:hypothetical protein